MNKTNLLLVIIFLSAAFFCAATGVASAISLSDKYVGNTVVDLEWTEWPEWPDGFSKYELCRDGGLIHTESNRSNTFYRDEGLSKGNKYNYEIKVYNASGGLVDTSTKTVTTGEVHGTITRDTTWTAATSPYGLTGTVIVDECATLTIQPGVTVNGGLYYRIDIKGTITPLDTVTFNGCNGLVLSDVDGFSIKNCVFENGTSYGIYLSGDNNALTGNTVSYNWYGICLSGGNNTLTGNIASNNGGRGIGLYGDNNTLTGSTASNNGESGIGLHGDNNTLTKNIANSNDYGIYLEYSDNNTLTKNTASKNNHGGIWVCSSSYNTLTKNTANTNDFYGIYLRPSIEPSENNILTSNTANSNRYGITLYSSNNNTLTNNTVSNNSGDGIYLSNNCTATGNTVQYRIEQQRTRHLPVEQLYGHWQYRIEQQRTRHLPVEQLYGHWQHRIEQQHIRHLPGVFEQQQHHLQQLLQQHAQRL
jgi:parallel beta-helix repeat protein